MNAALRVPANVVAKVAKVPIRLVLHAPLIRDPAIARRLVDNLEAFKQIKNNPNGLKALVKAAATDPQERLKNLVNQYSVHRTRFVSPKKFFLILWRG